MTIRDLKYYEQKVNNRFGTSAAPAIDASFLPETAAEHRLKWRKIPFGEVEVFSDGSSIATELDSALRHEGCVFLPIHPYEEDRWPSEEFVESGTVSVSASYRTMFFEPDPGGLLASVARPEVRLMMKLHLERPLPGIMGDRRISRKIAQKCVTLSTYLQKIMRDHPLGADCEVVPERFGLSTVDTGVIFREVPGQGVMPLFSLFSPDAELTGATSFIEAALKKQFGADSMRAAKALGEELASPLLKPLFVAFLDGFSIEMHAQNVLFQPGDSSLIDRVFVRDLEGVVMSNRYRIRNGLEPLFASLDNNELVSDYKSMTRWFNRNVDHDLGRVFTAALKALTDSEYFGDREQAQAVKSIRSAARRCVKDAGVSRLNLPGRILPISRSPYGNGLGKGHYYRSRYR